MSARITVDRPLVEFAIWALRKSNYLECANSLEAAISTEPGEAEGKRAPVDFYRVLKRFAEEDGSIREGRLTALSFALATAPLPEDIATRQALESDNG